MPDAHSNVSLTQLIAVVKALTPQTGFWTEMAKWSPFLAAIVAGTALWIVTNRQIANSQRLQREQLRDTRWTQQNRALRRAIAKWSAAAFKFLDAQHEACDEWLMTYAGLGSFSRHDHTVQMRERRRRLETATLAALAEAPSNLRAVIRDHVKSTKWDLPFDGIDEEQQKPHYEERLNEIQKLYEQIDGVLDHPAVNPRDGESAPLIEIERALGGGGLAAP